MATYNFFRTLNNAFGASASPLPDNRPAVSGFAASMPQPYLYNNVDVALPETERQLFENGPGANHYVFTVQDWRARRIAQPEPLVYEVKDEKAYGKLIRLKAMEQRDNVELQRKALEEVQLDTTVGLGKRLTNPNPVMTWKELMYQLSFYYDNGNGMLYGTVNDLKQVAANQPQELIELWPLSPYRWSGRRNGKESDGYDYYTDTQGQKIDAKRVLHVRRWGFDFNSNGEGAYWGRSPLASAKQLLAQTNSAQATETRVMANGGPQYIIYPKGATYTEEAPANFGEAAVGVRRKLIAGKTGGVVPMDVEIGGLPIGFTPEQLGIHLAKQTTKEEICSLYHVQALSVFATASGSTFANLLEANKASIRDGILPDLLLMYEKLTEWLAPGYQAKGQRLIIRPDLDAYDELQKDTVALVNKANGMILTGNERNELIGDWGKSDDPSMNVPLVPPGLTPLSTLVAPDAMTNPQSDGSYSL